MSGDDIEAVLNDTGLSWSRREIGWAVSVANCPREIRINGTADGVRIEVVLIEWDEAVEEARRALAAFLNAAGTAFHSARCEMDDNQARVVAHVRATELETDLGSSLLTVAAACRRLSREARALLLPDMARHYLEFHTS